MPRTANEPKPAEDQQPSLFSVLDLPTLPTLIEGAKQYIHTGKTTCKDEERAQAIAQAYLECGRILTVSRRFQISPNTVHAVIEVLERAGKLEGLKQRVCRSLGLLAEVSAERAIEMVADGKCPANVLPINVGVALDKKALLDGDPAQRIEVSIAAPLGVQDVLDYLVRQGIQPPAIEVESTVTAPDAEEKR